MEVDAGSRHFPEKKPFEGFVVPSNDAKKPAENNSITPVFVNHAANAWHENRRKWIGEVHQRPNRIDSIEKEPIISWSTTYEDLLSTNEPCRERIPLSEIVDFLVDIWLDEGLFE